MKRSFPFLVNDGAFVDLRQTWKRIETVSERQSFRRVSREALERDNLLGAEQKYLHKFIAEHQEDDFPKKLSWVESW